MVRIGKSPVQRPRLLLAYADSTLAVRWVRHFRRLGWEVRMAATGAETCRALTQFQPSVLVVDSDLPDETAWRLCGKVNQAYPHIRVFLVGADASPFTPADNRSPAGALPAPAGVFARSPRVEDCAEIILGQRLAEAI
jgi:CheY-like chemotaxis protein